MDEGATLGEGIPLGFPSPSPAFLAPHDFWAAVRRPGLLPRNAVCRQAPVDLWAQNHLVLRDLSYWVDPCGRLCVPLLG